MKRPRISVVVPVYKEQDNIRSFLQRTEAVLSAIGSGYEIIFALYPWPDRTEQAILEEIERNPDIELLVFSRRFGQPAAAMAGILNCLGEYIGRIYDEVKRRPMYIVDRKANFEPVQG